MITIMDFVHNGKVDDKEIQLKEDSFITKDEAFMKVLHDEKYNLLLHLNSLGYHADTNDEYQTTLKRLEALCAIERNMRDLKVREKHEKIEAAKVQQGRELDPDTIFATLGSLAAVGLILNYERLHALTSKGLGVALRMIPKAI